MRLTTLGDLLLDVVVHLDGPLVIGDDRVAVTHTGAGGQAANVAAWAQTLGAEARVVCKRGADAAGELAAREFARHGAEVVGPCEGRGGVVVSFAAAGDRTMASDRGSAPELRPDELDDSWFACDVLHLSGYALLREPIAAAATHAADSRPPTRRAHLGRPLDLDARRRRVPGADSRHRARHRLRQPARRATRWESSTRRGSSSAAPRASSSTAAPSPRSPSAAVDATGAGDALAAGFLVGGPELGLAAAARCCAKLGAMPESDPTARVTGVQP